MFFEYAHAEDRRGRALADVRMLECLASAMGLLAKGGAELFNKHIQDRIGEVNDQDQS